MKTSSAKAKGRNLQKWTREAILELFPQLSRSDVRSTSMGASGEDILLSTAALQYMPYMIECKSRNSIAVYKWLEQRGVEPSSVDAIGFTPLVIAKGNHKAPIVILYAEDFFNILGKIKINEN